MDKQKNGIRSDKPELSEKELEKVDGGMRVIVGNHKYGQCKRCGIYAAIFDGYCSECKKKIDNGE